ncbi:MAG TPA: hypothetical protein VNO30_44775 [Kofleriaceae bacterium]|nr:hypothetical protein [Kofleriaceae bacterium]
MTPGAGAPSSGAVTSSGEKQTEWGVGFRLRSVRAPKGLLELFVESAPGGVSNVGLGVDFVRRRGNLELQLGFEYERIEPKEGVWIQSNTNVAAGDEADFILSPKHNNNESLSWITAEFTFINHAEITKNFAIRYGGGAGIGILRGSLGRYDVFCNGATNADPEPGCVPPAPPFNGTGQFGGDTPGEIVKYNLPPVFPVVNAILGVQIRPFDKMTINIEGGLRTFPFFGVSGGYFF